MSRQMIATQHVEDLSKDELDNQKAKYETQGWTEVRVTKTLSNDWTAYEWSGIHVPSESIDFVNVTSRDPDLSEILELLEDEGIKGPTNVYWTQPYRFEDAFQVAIVWYTP